MNIAANDAPIASFNKSLRDLSGIVAMACAVSGTGWSAMAAGETVTMAGPCSGVAG